MMFPLTHTIFRTALTGSKSCSTCCQLRTHTSTAPVLLETLLSMAPKCSSLPVMMMQSYQRQHCSQKQNVQSRGRVALFPSGRAIRLWALALCYRHWNGDATLYYSFNRRCLEQGMKIDMTLDFIQSLLNKAGTFLGGFV